ncbi:hypothetical protein LINPERHAP2_LOCUS23750 [Linum perenne]
MRSNSDGGARRLMRRSAAADEAEQQRNRSEAEAGKVSGNSEVDRTSTTAAPFNLSEMLKLGYEGCFSSSSYFRLRFPALFNWEMIPRIELYFSMIFTKIFYSTTNDPPSESWLWIHPKETTIPTISPTHIGRPFTSVDGAASECITKFQLRQPEKTTLLSQHLRKLDKPVSNEHKRHISKRLTYEEKGAELIERLNALNSAIDDDSYDE